jgi:RNA polymerase sigma-70 factor (ECF subfamily)
MLADDANLVREAGRGNEPAFRALYERHRTPLFRFVYRLAGSPDVAEDVTQECFLALIQGAGFDANRGPLRGYLFGMARNLVFRRLRLSERESDEEPDAAAPSDLLGELLTSERAGMVAEAVRSLPALQREAIVLFEYEELSLEEISIVTGADVGAVKARLHRARESLRNRLSPLLIRDGQRSCL